MNQPTRLDNWIASLDGDLWQDVHDLVQRELTFRSWNEILGVAADASKRPGVFHRWVVANYRDSLAIAVRRLTDTRRGTSSLVRLLIEVRIDASQLTRDWWMLTAPRELEDLWAKQFDELAQGNDHIPKRVVAADLNEVVDACRKIKTYVDTHIAHLVRDRDEVEIPVFGEVHQAVVSIYKMFLKWYRIITGKSAVPLRPSRWEGVLTVAWIDEAQAKEIMEHRQEEWEQELREQGLK